jgi:DNA/RNA-binding domain of Phe-tRNA-synthetase-like protein
MKKFIVEDGFWELFPGDKIGVAVCRGFALKRRRETSSLSP